MKNCVKSSVFALCCCILLLIATIANAENFDPSKYDTQTLSEIQVKINTELAQRQVSGNSTLIPAPTFEGEIRFRDLEWGIDAETALNLLTADGFYTTRSNTDNSAYLRPWSLDPDSSSFSKSGISITQYSFPENFRVAGYPLSAGYTYFMFNLTNSGLDRSLNNSIFYRAEMKFSVTDGDYAYADLKNKLSSLYGEPEEILDTSGYWSTGGNYHKYESWSVWYGENNTGVYLYHTYDLLDADQTRKREELSIVYGKTDSLQQLTEIQTALENEAKEQERINLEQSANDTSGL